MNREDAIRTKAARAGIWLIGVLFLFAALVKAIDLPSFSSQIQRYELLPPELAGAAALAVCLLEALLGLACLRLFQARKALWGLLSLLAAFSAATLLRFEALQGTDCRCFGAFSSSGPEDLLLRNALLAACLAGLIVMTRKSPVPQGAGWGRIGSGLAAVLLAAFLSGSFAATDGLGAAPSPDGHVRVFLSASCNTCRKSLGQVGELASNYRLTPIQIFIAANRQDQIVQFLQGIELQGGYLPLTNSQLARHVERVPAIQFLKDSKILKEWVGEVPGLQELEGFALVQEGLPEQAAAKK